MCYNNYILISHFSILCYIRVYCFTASINKVRTVATAVFVLELYPLLCEIFHCLFHSEVPYPLLFESFQSCLNLARNWDMNYSVFIEQVMKNLHNLLPDSCSEIPVIVLLISSQLIAVFMWLGIDSLVSWSRYSDQSTESIYTIFVPRLIVCTLSI